MIQRNSLTTPPPSQMFSTLLTTSSPKGLPIVVDPTFDPTESIYRLIDNFYDKMLDLCGSSEPYPSDKEQLEYKRKLEYLVPRCHPRIVSNSSCFPTSNNNNNNNVMIDYSHRLVDASRYLFNMTKFQSLQNSETDYWPARSQVHRAWVDFLKLFDFRCVSVLCYIRRLRLTLPQFDRNLSSCQLSEQQIAARAVYPLMLATLSFNIDRLSTPPHFWTETCSEVYKDLSNFLKLLNVQFRDGSVAMESSSLNIAEFAALCAAIYFNDNLTNPSTSLHQILRQQLGMNMQRMMILHNIFETFCSMGVAFSEACHSVLEAYPALRIYRGDFIAEVLNSYGYKTRDSFSSTSSNYHTNHHNPSDVPTGFPNLNSYFDDGLADVIQSTVTPSNSDRQMSGNGTAFGGQNKSQHNNHVASADDVSFFFSNDSL